MGSSAAKRRDFRRFSERTHAGPLRRIRGERVNRDVDAVTLSRLLWRPEAAQILRDLNYTERRLRGPREELYQILAEALPLRLLSARVRQALKARPMWRDRPRPQ